MGFAANEAALAIVARPALSLELVDQLGGVDPAGWVHGVPAPEAADQGLLFSDGVALVRPQTLHANGQRCRPLL